MQGNVGKKNKFGYLAYVCFVKACVYKTLLKVSSSRCSCLSTLYCHISINTIFIIDNFPLTFCGMCELVYENLLCLIYIISLQFHECMYTDLPLGAGSVPLHLVAEDVA